MRLQPNERGQALIVVALFFFLVFLVFAAMAVDGTLIYLSRRRLQNMADAAALAAANHLSNYNDHAAAYQKAIDSIAANGGRIEWYSTDPLNPDPPNTNTPAGGGAGVNLWMGIEISGDCNVRVALRWSDMGTYFTQFFGRQTLQVGAKAHTACNQAGGLMPIAVRRFGDERHWNMNLKNVNQAKVYCDGCSTQDSLVGQGLDKATDFLMPEASGDEISQWPGWPDNTHLFYESPSPAASDTDPGRDHWILGNGVVPNVGTTSYSGLVNLDIRHVSAPPLEYYHGVDAGTNSNTLKDMAETYIREGYPYTDADYIPKPGEQVAMYNGTSASFSPVALQQTYNVGDKIAVIIYNGHVLSAPSLEMTGEVPYYKATYPTTSTIASNVLTYSIYIQSLNGFQSAAAGMDLDVEGLDGFAEWSISPDWPVLGRNGIYDRWLTLTVTPSLTQTMAVTPVTRVLTGTRSFYVSAHDNQPGGTFIKRYWAGAATVGDDPNVDKPAVTCFPTNPDQNYPFVNTVKGQQAQYSLRLDLWGVNDPSGRDVTVSSPGALPTGIEWVKAPSWTRTISPTTTHPGAKLKINLKVTDTVTINTVHQINLVVSANGISEPQTCNLYVLVEEAGATVNDYVEILGYAAVEITGYYNSDNLVNPGQSANAVRGKIVSALMDDPADLMLGLRARLWTTPPT
jgi:hypothetical protein